MSDELQAAIARWSNPKPAEAYPWPCEMHEQPAQRSKDVAMIARAYLSPPAAGPGLDAEEPYTARGPIPGEDRGTVVAEYDPYHPHERGGRDEKPVYDKDGRCLLCCRDYADRLKTTVAELRAALSTGEWDEPGNQLCESCESQATHRDVDDVPLCKVCWDELAPDPDERNGE